MARLARSRRISAPKRRVRALLATLTTLGVAATVAVAIPAAADPADPGPTTIAPQPSTAAEAKQAWLDAADASEAANEALLVAQENEKAAQQGVIDAKVALTQAQIDADNAQALAVQTAAKYASYREDLAVFASASFRGARLGQLSALLTAESTSDYLDEVSTLDQVAGSTKLLMIEAFKAKDAADDASTKAARAQEAAKTASAKADAALTAAEKAIEDTKAQKAELDSKVEVYHRLFAALSGKEREAAMAAQQAAWERQAQLAAEQQASQDQIQSQVADATAGGDAGEGAAAGDPADAARAASEGDDVTPTAMIVIQAALSKLGMPYRYGSSGPNSYDCSGLTSWAWAQVGVTLPRTSSGQASLPVVPLSDLRPGDLITYYSPTHHVALYIGNGQIIHASTEGKPVYITSMYKGGPYPVGHRVNY